MTTVLLSLWINTFYGIYISAVVEYWVVLFMLGFGWPTDNAEANRGARKRNRRPDQ